MRTKTLIASAILIAAGLASSSAQVFSVNVVGYVNKSLTAGFNLVANPLSNGDNSLSTIIPSAPDGTTVFTFNGAGYDSVSYLDGVGWLGNATLPPGVGFFVNAPSDTTVTMVGEVEQGTLDVALGEGFNLTGSRVPQETNVSALGLPEVDGLTVWKFNGAGYDTFSYIAGIGFLSDAKIGVGEGFFAQVPAGAGEITWSRDFTVEP